KERDAESGLDYFGARHYSSALGRFMSVDPGGIGATVVAPQSWNRYSYVLNNPFSAIGPNGLAPEMLAHIWWSGWQQVGEGTDLMGIAFANAGLQFDEGTLNGAREPTPLPQGSSRLFSWPNPTIFGNSGVFCPFTCGGYYHPNGGGITVMVDFTEKEVP